MFGTTRAQLSSRSWPSGQNGPIPLETFVPHAERREAESRRGKQRASRVSTVLLPIVVMIMNSIAAGLTTALPGTANILPLANPRQVWPTWFA